MYRQAKWNEPLIFELDEIDPFIDAEIREQVSKYIPKEFIRTSLNLPNLPEYLVVRHYTRLSQMNYGVDLGIYPLGSCTMKYNPRINEDTLENEKIYMLHPMQSEEDIQGLLKILYELSRYLSMITGMDYFTLQPAAGAHGEFVGTLIIKKYHEVRGIDYKDEIIIPDSAHGTNPASARMAGFKVIEIPSNEYGQIDLDALSSAVGERTAGLMLTNPNTLGIFESNIDEIAKIIHEVDGLLYYDGANLNALMGIARPGDMGFDIVHLNLHKTFSTPHGGGGPGSGPVGVKAFLKEFLPVPLIEFSNGRYHLNYNLKYSIGRIHSYLGNVGVLIKAYIYIKKLGGKGLAEAAEKAVLASNYLYYNIKELPGVRVDHSPESYRMHEFVISLKPLKEETGVTARDFAKRLLDYGIHAPTIYFPLIVEEALMIEPTESNTLRELDNFIEIFKKILDEAYNNPEIVKSAPHNTSVDRIDEAYASRPKTMAPTYKWFKSLNK
ncbi:MAG TPA: glycine dehydrogenase subunit 2 [Thermoprotei archaeon]|nr:glycine dehydrogenase subunit 2 [Thermoprotei archaeon]